MSPYVEGKMKERATTRLGTKPKSNDEHTLCLEHDAGSVHMTGDLESGLRRDLLPDRTIRVTTSFILQHNVERN